MSELAKKECLPCKGSVPALKSNECEKLLADLSSGWHLNESATRLTKLIETPDFKDSFAKASKLADLAEEQNHHPVLSIGHGFLKIEIWTHKIDALVESDFIYAAKADKILS